MKKPDSYAIRPIRTDADYRNALALVAHFLIAINLDSA